MNDSIGMNYCAPDANVWAVNLDGRYMSAVQNYLVADGIPTDGVTKIVSNAVRRQVVCFEDFLEAPCEGRWCHRELHALSAEHIVVFRLFALVVTLRFRCAEGFVFAGL